MTGLDGVERDADDGAIGPQQFMVQPKKSVSEYFSDHPVAE